MSLAGFYFAGADEITFRTNPRMTSEVTKDKPPSFESAENIESIFLSEHIPDPCRCQGTVLSLAYRAGTWMLM